MRYPSKALLACLLSFCVPMVAIAANELTVSQYKEDVKSGTHSQRFKDYIQIVTDTLIIASNNAEIVNGHQLFCAPSDLNVSNAEIGITAIDLALTVRTDTGKPLVLDWAALPNVVLFGLERMFPCKR